jgi:hypothetical protein
MCARKRSACNRGIHTDSTTNEPLGLNQDACETFGDLWLPITVQSYQSYFEILLPLGSQCSAIWYDQLGNICNSRENTFDMQRVSGARDVELCPKGTFTRLVDALFGETSGNLAYECCPASLSMCAATPSTYKAFFCQVFMYFICITFVSTYMHSIHDEINCQYMMKCIVSSVVVMHPQIHKLLLWYC